MNDFIYDLTTEFNNIFYNEKTSLNKSWSNYSYTLISILVNDMFNSQNRSIQIYNSKKNIDTVLNSIQTDLSSNDISKIYNEIIKMFNFYYSDYIKIKILKYKDTMSLLIKNQ